MQFSIISFHLKQGAEGKKLLIPLLNFITRAKNLLRNLVEHRGIL